MKESISSVMMKKHQAEFPGEEETDVTERGRI